MPGVAGFRKLFGNRALSGIEVPGFDRQRRLAPDDLDRFGQVLPDHAGTQDVVTIDDRLQGGDKGFAARGRIEGQQHVCQVSVSRAL